MVRLPERGVGHGFRALENNDLFPLTSPGGLGIFPYIERG
jgi:hypothetical protein